MTDFRDVVILLPGITGSVLTNAKGEPVWKPSAGAVWRAIKSVGGSLKDLELPETGDPQGVTATSLIPDVTVVPRFVKIDGYTRIERELTNALGLVPGANYFPFPYDWRLDNRVHAKRLESQALHWLKRWRKESGLYDAKLVLIGHSMGGLIARYFLECLGGWKDTRTLVTLGTPHQGSLNAVDFLEHGMKKGIGPLGIDLSPLLRSCPSVYQLLPIYRCIADEKTLSYVADAAASKTLPNVNAVRATLAKAFHTEISDAQKKNAGIEDYVRDRYRIVPLVGTEQPTFQSAAVDGSVVKMLHSLGGKEAGGDGTVPQASATPIELEKKGLEVYSAETHGSLQNGASTLAHLKNLLRTPAFDLSLFRDRPPTSLTLEVDDVVEPGEPLTVRARAQEGNPSITLTLTNADGGEPITDVLPRDDDNPWRVGEYDLPPGIWRVHVEAPGDVSVTDLAVVADAT